MFKHKRIPRPLDRKSSFPRAREPRVVCVCPNAHVLWLLVLTDEEFDTLAGMWLGIVGYVIISFVYFHKGKFLSFSLYR